MLIFWAVLGGFLRTLFLGDPAWLPHPVVLMGRCISALEKHLRTALPKTPRGELAGGAAVAAVLPLGTLAVTGLACWAAARLHPALGLALQMLWCGQALAAKGLAQESRNVYKELAKGDLPAARRAVARIVGRDTQNLTAAGVTRAAVETVAENASDGVIAPLLYMLLGGAPLALTYKAINTMDSMLGYKNEKYLYFGRCAAKLDDAANWLPSRLAALLWVAAAALTATAPAGRGASGGGTAAATPAPTAPRPRAPVPGHWACSWRARPITLANITISRQLETRCGRLSRGTSCVPTA